MSNELTTPTSTNELEELSKTKQAEQVLSRYEQAVHKAYGVTYIEMKITDEHRRILADRASSIGRSLTPCGVSKNGRGAAGAAVSRMFAEGWPLYKFDRPAETVTAYVNAFREHPVWAVEAVCLAASQGRLEGLQPNYPPAAAALVFHLDEKVRDMRGMRNRYLAVLTIRDFRPPAAPMTDEERAASRAKYEAWRQQQPVSDSLTTQEKMDREEADRRNEQFRQRSILAHYASEGIAPVYFDGKLVSLELIRNIERGKKSLRSAEERYKAKLGDGQQT